MFFDPRAAKLLKPGELMLVSGCPGLRLEAADTRRTWTYRYKDPAGRLKQLRIGHWPAMSAQAAMTAWQDLRDQRAAGVDIKAKRKAAAKPVAEYTVHDLVHGYINGHLVDARSDESAKAARRQLERLLEDEPLFASQAAAAVTRGVAFQILEDRKATPTATAKLRSLLGGAWDYALDAGRLSGDAPNWWRQLLKGRLKSKGKRMGGVHVGRQRRVLTSGEVATLLAWLPNMHELGRDTTVMYLWTCARGVEILAMRPEHVGEESDGWWWTVPKSQTKNADAEFAVDLRVPLIGRALAVVQRRLKTVGASGWLFEDVRKEQYTQHDFSTYIYNLQPYAPKVKNRQSTGGLVLPVTNWTPHNLRRTGRTMLSSLGCLNEIGEAILGHLPREIEATYNSHTYDKERRVWLGKLAKHLEKLAH
jgi:integrase